MNISEKTFKYINDLGISNAEFGRSIGVSRAVINNIINGHNKMTLEILQKIQKAYPNIDINKFIDDDVSDFIYVQNDTNKAGEEYNEVLKKVLSDMSKIADLAEKYKTLNTNKTQ